MLRWSILLGTFALWISCMLLVYAHCKPQMQKESAASDTTGLETLFAEDAEMERGCRIFVDMTKMRAGMGGTDDPRPANINMLWNGLEESRLTEVGWTKTSMKKKTPDATRVEVSTDAALELPIDDSMPKLAAIKMFLGTISYRSRADISLDQGLETFDVELQSARGGLQAKFHGVRDGDSLNIIQQVFQGETKLMDMKQKLPVGPKDAPGIEMFPFQNTSFDIRPGAEWTISMLDTTAIDLTGQTPPHIVSTKVKCTGKRRIFYDKEQVMAFEVKSEDNMARAWYSADGVVLKQTCRFLDAFEIMVVRIEAKKLKTYNFQIPAPNDPKTPAVKKSPTEKQGSR